MLHCFLNGNINSSISGGKSEQIHEYHHISLYSITKQTKALAFIWNSINSLFIDAQYKNSKDIGGPRKGWQMENSLVNRDVDTY